MASRSSGATAISAVGLVKRYGGVDALDGLDLEVPEGTVMALLGPNGAGKTTTIRVLTTLLRADAGTARVAGLDVVADAAELRSRIGVSGQYSAVDEYLTGFENLDMVGRLYHLGKKRSRDRARELLERFDLVEAADRPVKGYSGGMRRRLDLAGALVADPPVLFLDEPTTGLDPRARLELWSVIEELVQGGTTLLLTTQYLEEADQLADEIAVIDRGRVIERGTADELKSRVGGARLEFAFDTDGDLTTAQGVMERFAPGQVTSDAASRRLTVGADDGTTTFVDALVLLRENGVTPADASLGKPSLDDVFLTLTGQTSTRPDAADQQPSAQETAR
ncbi:ATP-binding cassette domain-containing protein [Rhodococcus sp. BP-349]|uniref:ATP-binding cassette domain-containing protein n=1 Tax=unclassified Rhodococcus (in: high G+C Gram-positive bacteria) TaxID=192944 RepID=UPI001C9B9160|nr:MULTISPECIES: ATP-binding cassette domain-containing protein [unclassified Rhodococcus (in: high G+C Gram-positive bacteria)]MBY6540162.1 ATP-binding cassette domain-containing protein [Rhodococcus sp. BP-363]MBY6543510.1 ATP-binding cassette domain-containing protein [Rhodococcus sp. BP-369]MBY6562740.1 ATP-binding cassette domain-containing protein [Rhodococcus sp. BP-370]MBY6577032.1 ATP-binding cassette domain-containing protein [Rhodococcus sp. BP-364]MBY6586333.1 ATP-binding cassette 